MLDIPVNISPYFVPAPHSIQWRNWEEEHKGGEKKKKAFPSDEDSQVSKYSLYQRIKIRKTSCPILPQMVELEMDYPSHILRMTHM